MDELLRLEEELLAAARAADEAVRLRRRLGERSSEIATGTSDRQRTEADPPGGQVREVRDREGKAWRIWAVRPGLGRPLSELHRYLGDYVNGWLAFGCLDNETRKRLPNFPPDWFQMGDAELIELLDGAIDVPSRKPVSGPAER